MNQLKKKSLIKAQQGELDAVLLYQSLAKMAKNSDVKEKFTQIAADEGKHAAILRSYTRENLKPKNTKALLVAFIYRTLGHSYTCKLLSEGEMNSIPSYQKLVVGFPRIKEIMEDEIRHARIAQECGKNRI